MLKNRLVKGLIGGFLGIILWSSTVLAATFYVGEDLVYLTITEALNAATSGDDIVVSAGTYVENIIMIEGVDIIATDGPEVTIIDGSSAEYGNTKLDVIIGHTVFGANNATLSGFTITGAGTNKKGILCWGSSPTLENLIITGNKGGGLDAHAIANYYTYTTEADIVSAPLIIDSQIINNGDTGAFFGTGSTGTIVQNTYIAGNSLWGLSFYNTVEMGPDTIQKFYAVIVEGNLGGDISIGQASAPEFYDDIPAVTVVEAKDKINNGVHYGWRDEGHKNHDEWDGSIPRGFGYSEDGSTKNKGEPVYATVIKGKNAYVKFLSLKRK